MRTDPDLRADLDRTRFQNCRLEDFILNAAAVVCTIALVAATAVLLYAAGLSVFRSGGDIFRIEKQDKPCPHCGRLPGGAP